MCRHAAYRGPRRLLAEGILEAPHSLLHQSYAPKELLVGSVNADGFGTAWYVPETGDEPALYRSTLPIWADTSFASVARHTLSSLWVANIRNGTETGSTAMPNVHPFTAGRWAFSHNGFIDRFREIAMRRLRQPLTDARYTLLRGFTESETLFQRVLDVMDAGAVPQEALHLVLDEAIALADEHLATAQMNVILTDGDRIWATRLSNRERSNSLYIRHDRNGETSAVTLASEPFDTEPGWEAVPDGSLVQIDEDGVHIVPWKAS